MISLFKEKSYKKARVDTSSLEYMIKKLNKERSERDLQLKLNESNLKFLPSLFCELCGFDESINLGYGFDSSSHKTAWVSDVSISGAFTFNFNYPFDDESIKTFSCKMELYKNKGETCIKVIGCDFHVINDESDNLKLVQDMINNSELN